MKLYWVYIVLIISILYTYNKYNYACFIQKLLSIKYLQVYFLKDFKLFIVLLISIPSVFISCFHS